MDDALLRTDLAACLTEWSQRYVYSDSELLFSGVIETEAEAQAFSFGGPTLQGTDLVLCVIDTVFNGSGLVLDKQQVFITSSAATEDFSGLTKWVLRSVDPRPDMSVRLHFVPVT